LVVLMPCRYRRPCDIFSEALPMHVSHQRARASRL
jgi:hypothetical protein